ncbi:helix-turn-helix domain-containing protein [Nonomuraea sp. LPB2021202275-12-8]|uniref:helix-turn-helix domain-containing protein n=1 Tax=Nonomuraea sp. LPB2021202275-12-8 TaxID=3120159 RepID=UPI003FA536BB
MTPIADSAVNWRTASRLRTGSRSTPRFSATRPRPQSLLPGCDRSQCQIAHRPSHRPRSERLLIHTEYPASAIAHRLGFDQATNFGKYFAHHVGMTPGKFRAFSNG